MDPAEPTEVFRASFWIEAWYSASFSPMTTAATANAALDRVIEVKSLLGARIDELEEKCFFLKHKCKNMKDTITGLQQANSSLEVRLCALEGRTNWKRRVSSSDAAKDRGKDSGSDSGPLSGRDSGPDPGAGLSTDENEAESQAGSRAESRGESRAESRGSPPPPPPIAEPSLRLSAIDLCVNAKRHAREDWEVCGETQRETYTEDFGPWSSSLESRHWPSACKIYAHLDKCKGFSVCKHFSKTAVYKLNNFVGVFCKECEYFVAVKCVGLETYENKVQWDAALCSAIGVVPVPEDKAIKCPIEGSLPGTVPNARPSDVTGKCDWSQYSGSGLPIYCGPECTSVSDGISTRTS